MDAIKRFLDCYIPVTTCNLRCSYCYVAQQGLFSQTPPRFEHSAQEVRRALSKKRMGGTCAINFCAGGETLISHDVLEMTLELLKEGHYVMIVSNGLLSSRFDEIATWPTELLVHLFIKFSFHFLELKRLDAFDTYFSNVKKMDRAGVSFTVELMPCDEEIPLIPEIKSICMTHLGALCHCTIGRSDIDPEQRIPHLSKLPFDEYKKIWSVLNSELFQYKSQIFYHHQDGFCYAGDWSVYIHMGTGEMTQCYAGKHLDNIFDDLDRPLHFEAIGKHCTQAHCYNGHAFLAWGVIPEEKAPTYAELRNRETGDGKKWLKPEMKAFMSTKLCQSNRKYPFWKKLIFDYRLPEAFHAAIHKVKAESK